MLPTFVKGRVEKKMHSFGYRDPEGSGSVVIFHYNRDLSGDVIIMEEKNNRRMGEVHVPGRALLEFVAEHLRRRYIGALEDMETDDILGIGYGV